jgi:hypothetical protein
LGSGQFYSSSRKAKILTADILEDGSQSHRYAPVAQGIERQPPELKVAGSNPAGRTSYKRVVGLPTVRLFFKKKNVII